MKGQSFNSRAVVHCIDLGMNAWHVAEVSVYDAIQPAAAERIAIRREEAL
jgi:predicted nucleic acid-binding protein